MKKINLLIAGLLTLSLVTFGQDEEKAVPDDRQEIKTGWSLGPLPTITYNSDLGFQYGGLLDLYNYGDGELYPNYYERYYLEISRFTKGNGINKFTYESNKLLKGRSVFFELLYRTDKQYDFFGPNGYESVYNIDFIDPEGADYKSRMFYKNETNYFKVKADILNPINDNWSWSAGIEFYNFNIKPFNVAKYNEGRDVEDQVPDASTMPGLYERYAEWGLIDAEVENGGSFTALKTGIMFDSRNLVSNATKGIWTELSLVYSPSFLSSSSHSYLKVNLTHRQYFTIIKDRLSFVYRVGYTGNLIGKEPYYSMPIMYDIMIKGATLNGLGGGKTLRGVKRNRVIGNGEAWINNEFRWRVVNFNMLNQYFYIGLVNFLDAGRVVNLIDLQSMVEDANITDPSYGVYAANSVDEYFNFGAEKLHAAAGLGLYIVMNENFIIRADYGRAFNIEDGISGFYVDINYLF
ncbi:MAG: hypothetical protein ABFS32_13335 [Bacteroidota bacterium]